jgi:hypothetical protein
MHSKGFTRPSVYYLTITEWMSWVPIKAPHPFFVEEDEIAPAVPEHV